MFRSIRTAHLLRSAVVAALLLAALPAPGAVPEALRTEGQRSDFTRTGRYAEVERLCPAFAERYPQRVRCVRFGTSPEGRPMLALAVSASGALTPQAARERDLPVVLLQGGIHAGEIDGKDAVFWLLAEMLEGDALPGVLERQVVLFVPVFNVDGHERFGAWNRPNQVGPEQMGWRTTAQNYNLNRDYAKADTPEMQAMLRLMGAWDPLVLADLHVTDGAKFEHDISITAEPVYSGDAALRDTGRALRDAIIAELAERGSLPLDFYPSFVVYDDPSSGFVDGVPRPRYSNGYMPLINRIGILVETHSWKDYATRVAATRVTVEALLRLAAEQGRAWRKVADAADRRSARLAGTEVALAYEATDAAQLIDFRGYAYTREPSAISGALMTRYDDSRPQIWRIPLRNEVEPSLQVTAPGAGYVIPAAHAAWASERLAVHGIRQRRIETDMDVQAQAFRATSVAFADTSFEGHQTLSLDGEWAPERRPLAAGALFVPIDQPKARLVMSLLEPRAPDAWAHWGYFNNAFEAKEYLEDYVAEDVAREMLSADPALARAFAERLADDEAFRADPQARLAFFAARHASHDERLNLYPVLRVDTAPSAPGGGR